MLSELLLKSVESNPNGTAILDPVKASITYSQLWELVKSTSARIEATSKLDSRIAIVADQDAYAVVACIAVMLTGRVVVPIDPRHSNKLIETMLEPLTRTIICQKNTKFSDMFRVISLDHLVSNEKLDYEFSSDNSNAYILHTSGTTGKPKAVLADQASLCYVASSLAKRYYITSKSRVLQFAYLSFDSSLIEIWSTLISGATLVIAGKRLRDDMYGCLGDVLERTNITAITLPPSIVSELNINHLSKLKTLVLAGEEFPPKLANRFLGKVAHIINAYGPTESIICTTTYEVTTNQRIRVPIGSPLGGISIKIDDPNVRGEGEMLIVSPYLAKSYVNDVRLTKMKFNYEKSGHRYYRTGDIGRLRDDGLYEYIGRLDNQVKINGQRVEIEGIEEQIRKLSGLNEIAVVVKSNQIYCFYRAANISVKIGDLSIKLGTVLPDHMIPRDYIAINKMPRNLNGKIDRQILLKNLLIEHKLSKSAKNNFDSDTQYKVMIKIWSELFKIPISKVRGDSSYFSFGGDSLSALRLIDFIADRFYVKPRLSELISDPATPNSMLEVVKQYQVGARNVQE